MTALFLYDTLLSALSPVARVYGGWDTRRAPARADEWEERLGRRLPRVRKGGLWLHGASVGEARLAGLLARSVRAARPETAISVSCVTRTGRAALPAPPAVDAAFFAPLDVRRRLRPVLHAVGPAALALIETELWPGLVQEAAAAGCRVALVNARLAPERMGRYRRLRALYRPLLRTLDCIGASSAEDAERLLSLGARPGSVRVTGNLKYDLPVPVLDPTALRRRFGLLSERPVLVAGSTGEGEDTPVLDAFQAVQEKGRKAFLVLAPRHPERAAGAAELARARGLRPHALSSGSDGAAGAADVLVVDRMGELASLYGMATVAFVGGSLVPVGGHNVLEPAAAGVPVLFGPHTSHVEEPAQALLQAGAARRVADGADLARTWTSLLGDAGAREAMVKAGRRVLEENRGALARTTELLEGLL